MKTRAEAIEFLNAMRNPIGDTRTGIIDPYDLMRALCDMAEAVLILDLTRMPDPVPFKLSPVIGPGPDGGYLNLNKPTMPPLPPFPLSHHPSCTVNSTGDPGDCDCPEAEQRKEKPK